MKKVITYGTYDLFHRGHYNLLKRAKELGDYLIVGVTTDNFDIERGKMSTCNSVMERIEAVKATGLADLIIIEEYKGQKIDDIQKYGVDIFAIGSDWEGYFDYLKEFCEVVYLPRTEGVSSTMLRQERPAVKIGIIGTGNIARRFIPESKYVNNVDIIAAYNPNSKECESFCEKYDINACHSINQLFDSVDSVYIASPYNTHYEYTKLALENGKNVLCEVPFVPQKKQAEELYQIAEEKNLILMAALKTAYCPAFGHLIALLKSGVIGDIVEVNVSNTTLMDETSLANTGGSIMENSPFTLLPIFKLLGREYRNINFYSKIKNGFDAYTKAVLRYDHAVASYQVGLGVKTEGNLVVSGTKGYAYVPAPWWRTDYFEVRFEDQNQNKKYFYTFAGEGLRYEIKDFVSGVLKTNFHFERLSKDENIKMSEVLDLYKSGINVFTI